MWLFHFCMFVVHLYNTHARTYTSGYKTIEIRFSFIFLRKQNCTSLPRTIHSPLMGIFYRFRFHGIRARSMHFQLHSLLKQNPFTSSANNSRLHCIICKNLSYIVAKMLPLETSWGMFKLWSCIRAWMGFKQAFSCHLHLWVQFVMG